MSHNEAWLDEAAAGIVRYAARVAPSPFLIEDASAYVSVRTPAGSPAEPRQWGGAVKRAQSWGSLRRVGYAAANSSNRSPKALWQYTGREKPAPKTGG